MFRVLRRRNIIARTFLQVGALLVVVYLCKDSIDHKISRLEVDVRKDGSQTKPSTKTTSYVYSWPRCEQNMSAASITNFSSLPGGIQDFLYYRHCRHFPMLLDIPDKCGGADGSAEVFLLLVIKNSPVNHDRREVLRKTWAKERLHNGVWISPDSHIGVKTAGLYIPSSKVDEYDPCYYKDVLLVHRFLSAHMYLMWHRIHDPNLKCFSSTK